MKLKIKDAKTILDSLLQLDGYDQLAKIDNVDKIVRKPYDLSGKTRWNIAKNITILSRLPERMLKIKNDLIIAISDGGNSIDRKDTVKINKFAEEYSSVLLSEEDFSGLLKLTRAELKLDNDNDVNPFPTEVIRPLIELGFIE